MSALAGPGSFDGAAERDDADRAGRSSIPEASGSMWLLPALLVGVVLFAIATSAHATLYKWVDQHGLVHYSDRLPPDAVNRASTQLNREGIAVKKTGQAPTAAELQARQAAEKQKRGLDRERMLAERRDRALLDSYTNESDIDLAKTRALATIEGQITSAQSYIAQIAKRRGELEAKQATYAPGRSRHRFGARSRRSTPISPGRPNSSSASRRKRRRSPPATTLTSGVSTT